MSEKLVTVAHYTDYLEADLARQLLEDEGIKAFVLGQNTGNIYSGVPVVVDIQLQTPQSQAEEAREVLEDARKQLEDASQDNEDDDWDDESETDEDRE